MLDHALLVGLFELTGPTVTALVVLLHVVYGPHPVAEEEEVLMAAATELDAGALELYHPQLELEASEVLTGPTVTALEAVGYAQALLEESEVLIAPATELEDAP